LYGVVRRTQPKRAIASSESGDSVISCIYDSSGINENSLCRFYHMALAAPSFLLPRYTFKRNSTVESRYYSVLFKAIY
jgi:hypothetical protein